MASDHTLIQRAIGGDNAALSELLERYGPRVKGTLHIEPRWQSVLSADDVMQVTYLEAFLRIREFAPRGEKSFQSWLQVIAKHNLLDAIRELSRAKRPKPGNRLSPTPGAHSSTTLVAMLGITTSTPSRGAARRELNELLESAIRKLPHDYQTVVREYDLAGRTADEVAAAMGRSVGAVYMLRARAHEQLRTLLGTQSAFFSSTA